MTTTPQPRQLMFQEQAGRFATTRETVDAQVATIRANGIRTALDLIVAGKRGSGFNALWQSYREQVRASGLAYSHLTGGHHLERDGGGQR